MNRLPYLTPFVESVDAANFLLWGLDTCDYRLSGNTVIFSAYEVAKSFALRLSVGEPVPMITQMEQGKRPSKNSPNR